MARVFLADDLGLQRKVVIKVLSPDLAEGLSQERFRRETHLAAQLQHPHLVPVLQAGNAEGLPYFVMPYVAGEGLRSRLREGKPLPVREAVQVLRDVARAMAYAHAEGVVHRDIKPDNVLISRGSAMVSDFGIAKALSSSRSLGDEDVALTRAGSSLGTPTYMAPEQAAADPSADHRVDIYAFGVMAYELLSGRPPFQATSPQALFTAHLVERPADLAVVAPSLPGMLSTLVMQCLEKDPANRPATATELVERLEGIDWSGEHAGGTARRRDGGTAGRRDGRWLFRRVMPLAGAGVLAAGVAWWQGRAPAVPLNSRLVTVVPFRIASADPSLHYLREGMLDLLAAKLPGQGGLQASEPRQVLDAWRAGGGSDTRDLPTQEAHGLARRLGSGWLLLGDVVGTQTHLVLNASLLPVGGATPTVRVALEGPPDSLGSLVDQMAEQLLAGVSGEAAGIATLGRTSLPQLRAYLDGVTKLRAGQPAAVKAFTAALDLDSTFAPAALGLLQASGWWSDGGGNERAARLAWAGRDQFSARDRALLEVTVGATYPRRPTAREEYDAAQRYLALAPDRADAWHLVGDKIYHFGEALGIADRAARSAEYFRKALALDSAYVPGYIHLQQLAVELGDTALDRRVERLRLAADSTGFWMLQHQWYRAATTGDTAGIRRAWAARPANDNGLLWLIQRTPVNVAGTDPREAMRALDTLIASAPPDQVSGRLATAGATALMFGQPTAARAYLVKAWGATSDRLAIRQVYDALLEAGDTAEASASVRRLLPVALAPSLKDEDQQWVRQGAARAVLFWRLSHGDTTGFGRLIGVVRTTPAGADQVLVEQDSISVAVLEAMRADITGDPAVRRLVDHLDSLMANSGYTMNASRVAIGALIGGALLEKHRGPERALAAVRRRATWWNNEAPYLAAQLREQGRLAALTGQRDDAIRAWGHYLSIRAAAEPAVQPQVDSVRRELARLTQR